MSAEEKFVADVAGESESSNTLDVSHSDEKNSVDLDQNDQRLDNVDTTHPIRQRDQTHTDNETFYQYLTFRTEVAITPAWANDTPPADDEHIPSIPNFKQYDHPFTWARSRKNWMTYLACSVNATAAWAAGSYALPADILTVKWHVSFVAYNVGITVYTLGFGVAPMILAPFSEINGRRPVFIASGLLFAVCQLCCALTPSYGGMIASRFFLGVGGSTFSTMVGGIIADIWDTADRNTPMVLFTGATLLGTGLGPLISGFVTQNIDWRWVFFIQLIVSGTMVVLVTFFFKETRGSVLLSRKAMVMNKYYDELEKVGAVGVVIPSSEICLVSNYMDTLPAPKNDQSRPSITNLSLAFDSTSNTRRLRYLVKSDSERASLLQMITLSLSRPLHMLVTEPVVFWFTMWMSFSWSVLFLQFGSVPLVFRTVYQFTISQAGAVFGGISVGAIISTIVSIHQEKFLIKHRPQLARTPEGRLYYTCIQSALMPVGMFWFGWTCYPHVHWILPTIGVALASMGVFSVFLAVFNYTADVYRIYASSALAGIGLVRNLLAGAFPLITKQMFEGLGFHAASSLLGGIGAVLTFVPVVLVFFGPRIRKRSRIARAFVEMDEEENDSSSGEGGGIENREDEVVAVVDK